MQFFLKLDFVVAARDTNGKAMGSAKERKVADAAIDVGAEVEATIRWTVRFSPSARAL